MPFAPGQSGNPGGRPKESARVRALAQSHADTAIKKIVALLDSEDEKTRLAAAQALLDRGFGKPAQAITGGDEDDNPLTLVHRIERAVVGSKD